MNARTASRLAWSLWAASVAFAFAALGLLITTRATPIPPSFGFRGDGAITGVTFSTVGALVASRRKENPIGWIFLGMGLLSSLQEFATEYAVYGVLSHPGSLPLAVWGAWFSNWIWLVSTGLGTTLLFLLFPDGRFASPRMRLVGWCALIVVALGSIAMILTPGSMPDLPAARNPTGITGGATFWHAVAGPGALALVIIVLIAAVSLFRRRRRAIGDERAQLTWMTFASLVTVAGFAIGSFAAGPLYSPAVTYITIFAVLTIPIAAGIAILKYRLYDIDLVIKKTVVFTVVTVVLTALYLGVLAVATLGTVSRLGVAVVLLAVTFRPVRRAARSLADRAVYGKRATSYEVLAQFSERMAETYATDDVLPRMAQILGGATGAASARVWLRVGGELRPAAAAGDAGAAAPVRLTGDSLPDLYGDRAVEVRHQGELLGALTVTMPPNDELDPGREKLANDLASQAGLVLRNVRLIEELKASRQRLLAAQDEERRKLERNIHDGAQQQLVALAVRLKLADSLLDRDVPRAHEALAGLQIDTHEALENLRDLARGIYPPLLADKGLLAALKSQAQKALVPVRIETDGLGRFSQEIEAAAYFCVLEALQNIGKYAGASQATLRLSEEAGKVMFEVSDDGSGFDPDRTGYGTGLQGMADRLEALGGTLQIRSRPGEGTRLTGRIPARKDRPPGAGAVAKPDTESVGARK